MDQIDNSIAAEGMAPFKGDPRAFFAAERTLLAWQRSAVALMGFGFVVERFGLFLHLVAQKEGSIHRGVSIFLGIALVAMGAATMLAGMRQFWNFSRSVDPSATPAGYWRHASLWVSTALVGVAAILVAYFLVGT